MLRTAFIGSDNLFDKYICYWLQRHSDLRLIIWTDRLEWSAGPKRWRKIARRYRRRAKRFGWLRAIDEILYFAVYHMFLRRREARRLRGLIENTVAGEKDARGIGDIERIPPTIRELRPADIHAPEVLEAMKEERLDTLFSICIDVILPQPLIISPRLGSYLWHEGITPEYRGVHSPFWTLANEDYEKLGYTLLKMNMKVDAGEIFVQGPVKDIDPLSDPPNYIGHKAILDSLENAAQFLKQLEEGSQMPLERTPSEDRLYSYPTASAFAKILWHRRRAKISKGDRTSAST
jgi:methionyl-tRNA formyltransferase